MMIDIERWIPERWDQIAGNHELKEYFKDLIWGVRKGGHRSGYNLLATGASRTGKTSIISFGIKCVGCLKFDFDTMNPCGTCRSCTMNHHLYGNDGWENIVDFLNEHEAPTPERSHQIAGMALQVLNKAHKRRSKLLTRDMVEGHVFDVDE